MILAVVGCGVALAAPFLFKVWRRQRRQRLLARQLRQSLHSMTHGLRAGHGFVQMLQRVAAEGDEPLAGEWKTVVRSLELGTSLNDAIADLGRRQPSREMRW